MLSCRAGLRLLSPRLPVSPSGPPPVSLPNVPLLPAPRGNVPEYGGPSQVVEPPQAPLDTGILAQILAAQGPAPTPPAPLGLRERFANALIGFGAGTQGYGPQFLQQLQEPQRRYEQQVENYNANQSRLKLLGTEAMMREQEATTRRAQEVSDREFNAETRREAQRLGFNDQMALEKFRDARQAQRDKERERASDEKLLQQQKLKFGEDLGAQTKFYKANGVKDPVQARRLALNDFSEVAAQLGYTVPELTKADNGALALVAAHIDRLNRLSRGGAAGGGGARIKAAEKAAGDFEASKRAVEAAVASGDVRAERLMRRRMDSAFGQLAKFPDLIESGYGTGGWPYQKPRVGAPAPAQAGAQQQQQMNFNLNQPNASSRQGPSQQRQAAKAKLMQNGYGDAEAEAELNRLGIK